MHALTPKEVIVEGSEACAIMEDLCAQFRSEAAEGCIPFSVVFVPGLVQGGGVEQAEVAGLGVVAAGVAVVCSHLRSGPPPWRSSPRTRLPQSQR